MWDFKNSALTYVKIIYERILPGLNEQIHNGRNLPRFDVIMCSLGRVHGTRFNVGGPKIA